MLWPHAYGAAAARACCSRLPGARAARRRVEVGGREGRHALLRSARAGCDQDGSQRAGERRATAPRRSSVGRRRRRRRRADAGPSYRNFEICEAAERTRSIINTGGQVTVEMCASSRRCRPVHRLSLLSGRQAGRRASRAMRSAMRSDRRAARYAHRECASITDQSRQARCRKRRRSTFTVRQESIAQPPVGPALRPPPKPQPRGAGEQAAHDSSRATAP